MPSAGGEPAAAGAWFEPNLGQADGRFPVVARGPGYALHLAPGMVSVAGTPIELSLPGKPVLPVAEAPLGPTAHYFRGDAEDWVTGVPSHARARYAGIHPGVDLVLYVDGSGGLELDFLLAAGVPAQGLGIGVRGAGVRLDGGDALLAGPSGELLLRAPVAWQEGPTGRIPVEAAFRLDGAVLDLDVGPLDPALPTVIDPKLAYSTYHGSTGSIDRIRAVATNPAEGTGIVYVTGSTNSASLPGPCLAPDCSGASTEMFVTKFDTMQTGAASRLWTAFLGGAGNEVGHDVAVDAMGVYVTGSADAAGYPVTANAAQADWTPGSDPGNLDVVFTKLNHAGTLVEYSTYLGGRSDDVGNAVAPDGEGGAIVVGGTRWTDVNLPSKNAVFPTHSGPYDPPEGGTDAFIARFDTTGSTALDSLVFSTFLGSGKGASATAGLGDDVAWDVHVGDGVAWVAGQTEQGADPQFFPTTPGAYLAASSTNVHAFAAALFLDGSELAWSTLFGGTGTDIGYAITSAAGIATLAGQTDSGGLATAGAFQTVKGGNADAFVARLDPGLGGAAQLLAATYLGGTGFFTDTARSVHMAPDGRIAVGGGTTAGSTLPPSGFPRVQSNPNVPSGAFDPFVARLNPDLAGLTSSVVYGSTLSDGTIGDMMHPMALDGSGHAIVGGGTSSTAFPTVGAAQPTKSSSTDGWLFRLGPSGPAPKCAVAGVAPFARNVPTSFSTAASVAVDAPIDPATWRWDLAYDGTFDANPVYDGQSAPGLVFTTIGAKTVAVRVADTNGLTDLGTCSVTISNLPPQASYTWATPVCVGVPVAFDGSASFDSDLIGVTSYSWSFGGGASPASGSGPTPTSKWMTAGSKLVTLTVFDGDGGSALSAQAVTVAAAVAPSAAVLLGPGPHYAGVPFPAYDDSSPGCVPISAWAWDLGADGSVESTDQHPMITAATAGTHPLRLTVTDTLGKTSWVTVHVNVVAAQPPTARFQYVGSEPHPVGAAFLLVDQSIAGTAPIVDWLWDIDGDGVVDATGQAPPALAFQRSGPHVLHLTVRDAFGLASSSSFGVTAAVGSAAPPPDAGALSRAPRPPLADFGFSPAHPEPGDLLELRDRSEPGDRPIAAWEWDFGDGGGDTLPATQHRFGEAGRYEVRLTIVDTGGQRATAVREVYVGIDAPSTPTPGQAFQVDAGPDQLVPAGSAVTLSGLAPAGTAFAWTQAAGPEATLDGAASAQASFTAPDVPAGETEALEFRFDASLDGAAASDTVTILVQGVGAPPPAEFDLLQLDGGLYAFRARQPEGRHLWDFGDGATSGEAEARHAFTRSGVFTVRHTLVDASGWTATSERQVEVEVGAAALQSNASRDAGVPDWVRPLAILFSAAAAVAAVAWSWWGRRGGGAPEA